MVLILFGSPDNVERQFLLHFKISSVAKTDVEKCSLGHLHNCCIVILAPMI